MLRILNPNHMVELLREGKVPPMAQLSLVALVITFQCLLGRPGLIGPFASPSSFPFAAFQLCMVLVTLWLAFKANGGAKGKDFITRYAMLACVLLIWVQVIGYVLYIAAYFVLFSVRGSSILESFRLFGPAQLAHTAISSLAFLLSLQHFISKAAVDSTT